MIPLSSHRGLLSRAGIVLVGLILAISGSTMAHAQGGDRDDEAVVVQGAPWATILGELYLTRYSWLYNMPHRPYFPPRSGPPSPWPYFYIVVYDDHGDLVTGLTEDDFDVVVGPEAPFTVARWWEGEEYGIAEEYLFAPLPTAAGLAGGSGHVEVTVKGVTLHTFIDMPATEPECWHSMTVSPSVTPASGPDNAVMNVDLFMTDSYCRPYDVRSLSEDIIPDLIQPGALVGKYEPVDRSTWPLRVVPGTLEQLGNGRATFKVYSEQPGTYTVGDTEVTFTEPEPPTFTQIIGRVLAAIRTIIQHILGTLRF